MAAVETIKEWKVKNRNDLNFYIIFLFSLITFSIMVNKVFENYNSNVEKVFENYNSNVEKVFENYNCHLLAIKEKFPN